MIVGLIKTNNITQSFSDVILVSHTPKDNSLKMEFKNRILTATDIKHYTVFADNGTEIFSAKNLDQGFDDD